MIISYPGINLHMGHCKWQYFIQEKENEKLWKYLSKGDILEVNPIQKIPRIKRPKTLYTDN